jgi:bifunctional ADP-heptose synthase (sugar kinase/adenylyltransferase)
VDTRNKIIDSQIAVEIACRLRRQSRKLVVVSGHFDVVLAAHARDLDGVRNSSGADAIMVILQPVSHSLLAAPARAELVAALAMVDYVVSVGDDSLDELLSRLPAERVISRLGADDELKRLLIEHVQSRHSL